MYLYSGSINMLLDRGIFNYTLYEATKNTIKIRSIQPCVLLGGEGRASLIRAVCAVRRGGRDGTQEKLLRKGEGRERESNKGYQLYINIAYK